MTIWNLLIREIIHRRMSFALAVLSVMVASGSLIGSVTLLRIHDIHTGKLLEQKQVELEQRMAQLEDDTRKAMLKITRRSTCRKSTCTNWRTPAS